jgi:hypothetical protein
MQRKLILISSLLVWLIGAGFATTSAADEASAEKVKKLITAADDARKQAASVGGEWRDTGKMIKQAKALLEKGDFVTAAKLANKAAKQGHLGYEQAVSQKALKMPSYLHY